MPAVVERCVSELQAKWKKDPKSRPKPKEEGQTAESQAFAICNAAQKAEAAIEHVMLEGIGPVIAGVAVTNRPHLPLPPMSMTEDGKVRVPFLMQGIFKHPKYGNLVFNQSTFDRMLNNHRQGYAHHGVSLDVRHKPELGALAWLSQQFDGDIVQETDEKGRKLLVGYGKPTSEAAQKVVEGGQYRFASIDFYPNFESDVVELLSSDDLESITLEELLNEEGNMTYPVKNEDGTVLLSADQFTEFEGVKAQVGDLTKKLEAAEAKIVKFEKPAGEDDRLPAEFRVLLERRDAQMADMQKKLLRAEVASIIADARAFRDTSGRAHSPVLLEWAEGVLTGQAVGSKDEPIRLEKDASEKYFFEAVTWLLKNVPGQVPVEGHTEHDDVRLEMGTFKAEDFKSFWGAGGGE